MEVRRQSASAEAISGSAEAISGSAEAISGTHVRRTEDRADPTARQTQTGIGGREKRREGEKAGRGIGGEGKRREEEWGDECTSSLDATMMLAALLRDVRTSSSVAAYRAKDI